MFQFMHPRPVVDRRPVAEHSIQWQVPALPALIVQAVQGAADAPQSTTADIPNSAAADQPG